MFIDLQIDGLCFTFRRTYLVINMLRYPNLIPNLTTKGVKLGDSIPLLDPPYNFSVVHTFPFFNLIIGFYTY